MSLLPASNDGSTMTGKSLLKLEFFDNAHSPAEGFKGLLQALSEGSLFYPSYFTQDYDPHYRFLPNHGDPIYEQQLTFSHMLDSIDTDTIDAIKGDSSILPVIKNTFPVLDPAAGDNPQIISAGAQQVKEVVTSAYPTIVYGSEATGILSAKISSRKDPRAIELAIVKRDTLLNAQKGSAPATEITTEVYPVECSFEAIGCPLFMFGQEFFIDFGTGTNIDNLYTVLNVNHKLVAGEFSTSVDLIQGDSFPTLVSPRGAFDKLIASTLGTRVAKQKASVKGNVTIGEITTVNN